MRKGIRTFIIRTLAFAVVGLVCFELPATAHAKTLSTTEARKLISSVGGFALKKGSIHVRQISVVDAATVIATADIELALRLEQNDQGQWRVAEVRSGQDRWEEIAFIMQAVKGELNATACDLPELAGPKKAATDISVRRARCLIANLLAVPLPSDSVRIKSVSPLGLPLVSHQSALVDAHVEADFRFIQSNSSWRLNGFKTGTRDWADPEAVLLAVNKEKVQRAQADLQVIAKALEDFRVKRGYYIESKSEAVLIDFLSPLYLGQVVRLDPWRRPYQYEGTRDRFSLSSTGPDGKEHTNDDIVISGPGRSTARARITN
jgi:hypothetical protein